MKNLRWSKYWFACIYMGDIAVYNGTQAGLAGPHLWYFICWKSICTPLAFSKPITIYPRRQQRFEEAQERPPRWWQLEHSPSEERLVELVLFSLDGFRWTWQKLQYQLGSLWGNRLFTVEHDKRIQDFGYKLKQEMYRLRFYLSIWLYCRIFNRIASWKLRLLGLHLKERKTCPGFITTFWVVAGCPGIPT